MDQTYIKFINQLMKYYKKYINKQDIKQSGYLALVESEECNFPHDQTLKHIRAKMKKESLFFKNSFNHQTEYHELPDTHENVEDQVLHNEVYEEVKQAISMLDEREQYIIVNYNFNNLTLQAIANNLKLSVRQVIRIKKEANFKLSMLLEDFKP